MAITIGVELTKNLNDSFDLSDSLSDVTGFNASLGDTIAIADYLSVEGVLTNILSNIFKLIRKDKLITLRVD